MAAISGIGVSEELTQAFSTAVETRTVRFIKVIIQNESLVPVPDSSISVSGSLDDDLHLLQDHLEETVPCYILARLDDPPTEWLAISYVPEGAKVREKMLYASTRNALTKSLGSAVFTDSLFATAKSDITPEAYAAHRRHQAAPKPLSAREQEIADIKAAERELGTTYEGSRARQNHLGNQEVGYTWANNATEALADLRAGNGSHLVVLQIDGSEQIILSSSAPIDDVSSLSSNIPPSVPSYCFFAWQNAYSTTGRDIAFIYSCPSTSPIKSRMVYSTGAMTVFRQVKDLLGEDSGFVLAARKIETSDPKELTGAFLKEELNLGNGAANAEDNNTRSDGSRPSFAKPKGPGRRR